MSKRNFGLTEIVILIAIVGAIATLGLRTFYPEVFRIPGSVSSISMFVIAGVLLWLTRHQWLALREVRTESNYDIVEIILILVRMPLYVAASSYFIYLSITGG